jgi:hypothetical protein
LAFLFDLSSWLSKGVKTDVTHLSCRHCFSLQTLFFSQRRKRKKKTLETTEEEENEDGKNLHFMGHPLSRQLSFSFKPPHASQRPRSLRCCLETAESTL